MGVRKAALLVAFALTATPLSAGVNAWTNNGPDALVTALAVDPTTGDVYAAVPGRIRKSVDHGATWTPIGPEFDPQRSITALAVDPTNGATIYAGIEQDGGVVKSVDGGATFAPIRNGLPAYPGAFAIIIAPSEPNTIYLLGNYAHRSTDGGASWTPLGFPGSVESLAVDPDAPDRILAGGLLNSNYSIVLSEDAGLHWRPAADQREIDGPVSDLKFDAENPNLIFAAFGGDIARSQDAGETWAAVDANFGYTGTHLAIDSLSGILYTTDLGHCIFIEGSPPCIDDLSGIYSSGDGGRTWTRLADQQIRGVSGVALDPTGRFVFATSLSSNGVSVFEYPWPPRLPIQPPARRPRTALGRPELLSR